MPDTTSNSNIRHKASTLVRNRRTSSRSKARTRRINIPRARTPMASLSQDSTAPLTLLSKPKAIAD
jgi:hypothetical protein